MQKCTYILKEMEVNKAIVLHSITKKIFYIKKQKQNKAHFIWFLTIPLIHCRLSSVVPVPENAALFVVNNSETEK